MELAVLLKYSAPVAKASPSLSTDGLELFAPKYLSSKSSKLAAAAVAELFALVAEVDAPDALLAAAVAELAALPALVAAVVVDPNVVSIYALVAAS